VSCWNCGTANEPGARFCIQCGAPQSQACATCGHANPSGARFCSNCGSPLVVGAAPAAPPQPTASQGQPVAERRLVSVLFADLVGFTTLSEDRDPEETRELLSRYFEVARRTVEGHGGTIEKFIGDAVMAVWGAPTAHEDDAERAVRAALELVGAVGQIAEGDQQLRARAGVLTGEAAVTIGAEGQGMVAGDLVNTASRLQSVAPPGTVLVGEATYRAASNAVSFEPAGEQLLKGKTAPVPAWRAVAVVARRGGGGRASTLEPPFVGREDELQMIKDLFAAASRDSKPRLVTVIGQAGIGKSRLAWEFEKYLDGVVETAYWHEGRSPAYGEGVSYWALAEMVRRRAGIAEGDDPAETRSKLAAMLEEFIPDPDERRWVEPRLAGLLGLAELPREGREELFSAWRTLFERIAAVAPTILVFVDLHWADDGLLDFVEDLLAWARSSPIFVVALARPELLERRPDWGSTVRSMTRINLGPLDDDDMQQLLGGLLPGLPEAGLRRIVERAEGIPLYAVETVRMLLDTGAVVEEDGHYRVEGDLTELAVAETLHALIAARLDANPPEDRALLQDAAVLGLSFPREALAAINALPGPMLDAALERLVRRQFLQIDTDPRSPERGQYRFVQALLREIAYQSLARADRRERHLAAARYFEALGEDELAGVLASHYLDAYRSSRPGPEADAVAAQARIALQAAADRAVALHSHRQAVSYLEQALIVTQDPAEQANLHERIAVSGEYAGLGPVAADHAREAAALYRQVGDQNGAIRADTWVGRHLVNFQQLRDAVTHLEGAIADVGNPENVPELAAAYAELARGHMLQDEHEAAVLSADRALRQGGADPTWTVEALVTKGTSLSALGRNVESVATLRGAIDVAERQGMVAAALRARNNLSFQMFWDDLAASDEVSWKGYEMAVRYGHRGFLHQFLLNNFELNFRRGDLDADLDEVEAIDPEEMNPFFGAAFLGARAMRQALRGADAEAARLAVESARVASDFQSNQLVAAQSLLDAWMAFLACDWRSVGRIGSAAAVNSNFATDAAWVMAMAAAAGNLGDDLDAAIAALDASPLVGEVTTRLRTIAPAARADRLGHGEEADAGFGPAREWLLEHGDLLYGHFAGLLWSELAAGRRPEAAAAGAEAHAFFAERGALPFVNAYRAAFVHGDSPAPRAEPMAEPSPAPEMQPH
jgi:class 3 adenylate cyclase